MVKRKPKIQKIHHKQRKTKPKLIISDNGVKRRWDYRKTVLQNYHDMGLKVNPNEKDFEAADPIQLEVPEEAPPREKLLTQDEIWYIKRLINKYGTNYVAMFRDIKLNYWQHTARTLEKMAERYYAETQAATQPTAAETSDAATVDDIADAAEEEE